MVAGATSSFVKGKGERVPGMSVITTRWPRWREQIDRAVEELGGEMISLRRHLHMHPEPSHEEFQTTSLLAQRLEDRGIACRVAPSGRGLIAGSLDGERLVALRADIDALRIRDEKDVPYRSCREGLMHACGHDAHTAMAYGATLALAGLCRELGVEKPSWRTIFQPSEEEGEGAAEMVGAGAMEGVSSILALHVDPDRCVGEVGWRIGPLTACCDELHLVVHGRGGHAARPHLAIDPIVAAVQFLSMAYLQVPRSVDSREPVVVTFGAITGGTQSNVIPDKVVVRGTVRTFSRAVTARVEEQLLSISRGIESLTGARLELSFLHGPDAVVNDPAVTTAWVQELGGLVGQRNVREITLPSLGGEDFAAYLKEAPGCLLRIGAATPGTGTWPSLHSPLFDIDERMLTIGAKALARGAIMLSTGGEERGGVEVAAVRQQ